ncbi:hypothetical protein [Sandarakinorhabdus sp.]|uniref:hypothetical protein n=1 Tax=Sandarakinorhabdus sp. TaxID=1916663 RepID=UPI00286E4B85|nr:hypothetical protein [Sandarakinorhabdus sp.]
MSAPVFAAEPAPGSAAAAAREHQLWIDEHARWNAEHLAAARRLEAIAAALRSHATSFDRYGDVLRAHERRFAKEGHVAPVRAAHARLLASHKAARAAHDRVMRETDDLERTMAADFAKADFLPK